jgi:hypothetical protein
LIPIEAAQIKAGISESVIGLDADVTGEDAPDAIAGRFVFLWDGATKNMSRNLVSSSPAQV